MTRIAIGARVIMNPNTVASDVLSDSDYEGVGILRKDDESGLPYLVEFPDTGHSRWFEEDELLLADAGKFRVLLSKNPIDRDGDVQGHYFVTQEAVDPRQIPKGVSGKEGSIGFANVGRRLSKDAKGAELNNCSSFNHAYVLVEGLVMELTSFAFVVPSVIHTPQLEVGCIYSIGVETNHNLPEGTIVELVEQEPASYRGLAYLVRKVNTSSTIWISNESALNKL